MDMVERKQKILEEKISESNSEIKSLIDLCETQKNSIETQSQSLKRLSENVDKMDLSLDKRQAKLEASLMVTDRGLKSLRDEFNSQESKIHEHQKELNNLTENVNAIKMSDIPILKENMTNKEDIKALKRENEDQVI